MQQFIRRQLVQRYSLPSGQLVSLPPHVGTLHQKSPKPPGSEVINETPTPPTVLVGFHSYLVLIIPK